MNWIVQKWSINQYIMNGELKIGKKLKMNMKAKNLKWKILIGIVW